MFNLSAGFRVGGQCHAPAALSLGKRPVIDCTGGLLGPWLIWMGVERR